MATDLTSTAMTMGIGLYRMIIVIFALLENSSIYQIGASLCRWCNGGACSAAREGRVSRVARVLTTRARQERRPLNFALHS